MSHRIARCGVILGASTGTGAAIARALPRGGDWHLVGFHRGFHLDESAEVAADVNHTGSFMSMHALDVGTDFAAVQHGLDVVEERLGKGNVSFVVHALSGAHVGKTVEITADGVAKTFARQAHSFLWWAQGLRNRDLLTPNATLLALTNPVATNYLSNSGVIGPAKAALEAYVRCLAVEMGRETHRVFAIRFGAVVTPAFAAVAPQAVDKLVELHRHISPAYELQTTDEIGRFVATLVEHDVVTDALNGAIVDFTFGSQLTLLDYAFNR